MVTNLEKYNKDLDRLIANGDLLYLAMNRESNPDKFRASLKGTYTTDKELASFEKKLPSFRNDYQSWYSESIVVMKQILPDRLADFIRLYERPKTKRKDLTAENYTIGDALQGLEATNSWTGDVIVGGSAAIPLFRQQLSIIRSIKKRFESSLFDIQQLVQADLFDSELEAAKELNKKGFVRGAGAVAGVVLEGHLRQVCDDQEEESHPQRP